MASTTEEKERCMREYDSAFRGDVLQGQVAVVTGGATGIGFTITEVLMRHGCDCCIVSRNRERLDWAAARLQEAVPGRTCIAVQADVRDFAKVQEAIRSCQSQLPRCAASGGKIDILVNAAAGNFLCPASRLSSRAMRTVLEIDTLGTFHSTRAVFDASMKRHGGSIVNITATLHYNGDPFVMHAGAAKAAIDAMTRHLAVEWGPNGVRVNNIAPGPIADTEGYRRLGGSLLGEQAMKLAKDSIPVGRLGTRNDIAQGVLWLCSPAASWLSGQVVVIDGASTFTASAHQMAKLIKSKL